MYLSFHPPTICNLISTLHFSPWLSAPLSFDVSSIIFSFSLPSTSLHKDLGTVITSEMILMVREFREFRAVLLWTMDWICKTGPHGVSKKSTHLAGFFNDVKTWSQDKTWQNLYYIVSFSGVHKLFFFLYILPGTCRRCWIQGIWHHRRVHRAISLEQLPQLQEDPN